MALIKSSSLQFPIPVSVSGVMFVPKNVPNGVLIGLPPARNSPSFIVSVWQLHAPEAGKIYLPYKFITYALEHAISASDRTLPTYLIVAPFEAIEPTKD